VTDPLTCDPGALPRWPVAWDVSLSVGLVIVTALAAGVLSLSAAAVRTLGVPNIGTPAPVVIAAGVTVAASILAPRVLQKWSNARRYSRHWLTLAALLGGAAGALAALALAPWPDLLSDEVAKRGEAAFLFEGVKTFVPWVVAVLAAFVTLRCAHLTAPTKRE
jgi:hypothetical protein